MTHFDSSSRTLQMICNACAGTAFQQFTVRGDGMEIQQCKTCGLGLVARLPESTAPYYDDSYYFGGGNSGYEDYRFMAEHGLGWASALLQLFVKGGKILDIGCADGYLLSKLPSEFEKFGIEVNANAAATAQKIGVQVIGHDLLAPSLVERHRAAFDVVTSIAVFEHLLDFRGGFEAAMAMLCDDGFLLFEVPVMSPTASNAAWLQGSFEHIYYPTEASIRHVVEAELGCHLVGAEVPIKDYASTYIGMVTRTSHQAGRIRAVFDRVVKADFSQVAAEERRAATQLHLIHAGQASNTSVGALASLDASDFNRALIARIAQLWSFDLGRLDRANERLAQAEATASSLRDEAGLEEHKPNLANAATAPVPAWQHSPELVGAEATLAQLRARLAFEEARAKDSEAKLVDAARHLAATEERIDAVRRGEKEACALQVSQAQIKATRALASLQREAQRATDLEAAVNQLRGLLAIEEARTRETENQAAEAERQRDAIEQSMAWRATGAIRRWGIRHPGGARRLRQAARLIGWTLRGTVVTRLRETLQLRAAAEQAVLTEEEVNAANEAAAKVMLLPTACVLSDVVDEPVGSDWPLDRPLVSIVIPCFNYGHLVAEAIASAQAQTFSDIEILVVEGGSTSPDSRRQLLEATASAPSRVRVLVQDEPHRAGANRNFGISHARGKYVCCLDADDRLAATYIEKAVFMLEHSGYDVISPALQLFGTRSEVWAPRERPTLDMMLEENNALTCAVFLRAFWVKAGGFRDSDRSTGHMHEDWLFWARLAALGARFICIREPLFFYRSHPGTLSNASDVLDHEVQKRLVVRFNEDVLTAEALERARTKSLAPPPRPTRSRRLSGKSLYARSTALHDQPVLLIAMPFLVLGGAERLLSAVVAQLARQGWRVIIVTTVASGPEHGDTTSWFEPATAEIFHLPRFLDHEYWREFLIHLFDTRDIQLLWVIGSAFVYEQLPLLKLMHPPLKVADLLFNTVGHTTNNRRYADCIDRTFVENREVRQWLIDAGEMPERISLVESGVDLHDLTPRNRDVKLAELTGVPLDAVVVGFFGRWSEEKDPLGFIEIARRTSPDLNVVFMMTGAGHLEAQVRQAIALASFEPGRFLLKGSVPEVLPYLQACDVLCLPSRLDGRPNVVMEALATGTAVVASSVGALPDMVEDGRQGFLCKPGAYGDFAQKIEELASDPEMLRRFQSAARSHAERRFDISSMLAQYEAELGELIPHSS